MKTIIAMLCLLALSGAAFAQSPDSSKWMCRNLADSGGFTYQGETIFGTQACRPISQAVAQAQLVTASPTTVASAQAQPTPAQQSDAPVQQPAQSTPVVNRQSPVCSCKRRVTETRGTHDETNQWR
jgi:hypothetical protein